MSDFFQNKEQVSLVRELILKAEPMNFMPMLEADLFKKFDLTPEQYLSGFTLDEKVHLIRTYGNDTIFKLLLESQPELLDELSGSLSYTAGQALCRLMPNLNSDELLRIAERTSLIVVYIGLVEVNNVDVNNWFSNLPIGDIDHDVITALSNKNIDEINVKIAECKTDDVTSEHLYNVALNCSLSLHDTILENPHVTSTVKHALKSKESKILNMSGDML